MSYSPEDARNILGNIETVDIVVVGGGCAGAECASKLYAAGFTSLVILEAQDYLGGRIKTDFINDDEALPLEMGATWIHGLSVRINEIKTQATFFEMK